MRRNIYSTRGYNLQNRVVGSTFGLAVCLAVLASFASNSGAASRWSTVFTGLMMLAIVGWNLYWYLWRVAGELHVRENLLKYHTPLRRGAIPLAELVSLRPERLSCGTTYVIISARQRPLLLLPGPDLRDFAATLIEATPTIAVRCDRWGRA